jgi:hypothetical protein
MQRSRKVDSCFDRGERSQGTGVGHCAWNDNMLVAWIIPSRNRQVLS